MKMLFRQRHRLCLELLEVRCLPSTVTNLREFGPGSLGDAIATTPDGGTVDFQPGLSGTIVLTKGIAIFKDLTIEGPGANVITVSTNHLHRVFYIANFTVAVSGLTIADGRDQVGVTNPNGYGGGGILNFGTLTVADCIFSQNSANVGAGIENYLGTLTVTGCTFSGNQTYTTEELVGSGAGINNDGTLTVTDCTFSGNSADDGGGINNLGGLTVTGSTFSGNSKCGISNDGPLTVIDSSFRANSSSYGGGIFDNGPLIIIDSAFSDNSAGYGAGMLSSDTVIIIDSTFSGNSATKSAGGIYNTGTLIITASTFSGNSAGMSGGAVYGYGYGGSLTITDSTFCGNSANFGGGGIVNIGTPTIRNALVAGNTAQSGPDIFGPIRSLGHNLMVSAAH